jgi:hypothetical protein
MNKPLLWLVNYSRTSFEAPFLFIITSNSFVCRMLKTASATAVHITIGHAALAASVTVEQRVEVMTGKQRKGAPRLRYMIGVLRSNIFTGVNVSLFFGQSLVAAAG